MRHFLLPLAVLCLSASSLLAASTNDALAQQAISPDSNLARAAIHQLREQGPPGLEALLRLPDVTRLFDDHLRNDPQMIRYRAALDAVAAQRNGWASRLYWYTDLEQAKAAAAASGKPILSLRLLGKLTDEFSCANSRFFRTVLYANQKVSDQLREKYILHWSSERPVPQMTIDYGDGRVIRRTITGNSAHYVLDSRGRPVDVLPGVYTPQEFLLALESSRDLAARWGTIEDSDRQHLVADYHRRQLNGNPEPVTIKAVSMADQRFDVSLPFSGKFDLNLNAPAAPAPMMQARAFAANDVALTKGRGETRPLAGIVPTAAAPAAEAILAMDRTTKKMSVEKRPLLAIISAAPSQVIPEPAPVSNAQPSEVLDSGSRQFIRWQNPIIQGGDQPRAGSPDEVQFARLASRFEQLIRADSLRNETDLHRKVHQWLATDGGASLSFQKLNDRIYAELFLTPRSDPWLGLVEDDIYTALENNGLVCDSAGN